MLMDMRRLMGYKEEDWNFIFKRPSVFLTDEDWEERKYADVIIRKIEELAYEKIPERYDVSFDLYDRIKKNCFFFEHIRAFGDELQELSITMKGAKLRSNGLIELGSESVYIDVLKKRKKIMVVAGKNQIEFFSDLYMFSLKDIWNNEILNILQSEQVNKWTKELTKENEQAYKKEYEGLKDKNSLISEKYIMEYIKKYVEKV